MQSFAMARGSYEQRQNNKHHPPPTAGGHRAGKHALLRAGPMGAGLWQYVIAETARPQVSHDHPVSEERAEPFAYAGVLSTDFHVGGKA
jgi:hypothetical protein